MSLPSFWVVVSNIGLSNELAQLDVTEMDSNANSTDNSEQKSSDEEENGVVESLLNTAYLMQQSSAKVESPAERSSLLLLDPEINSAFDDKQLIHKVVEKVVLEIDRPFNTKFFGRTIQKVVSYLTECSVFNLKKR